MLISSTDLSHFYISTCASPFLATLTCSLPRLFQPHCDVQDSFLFPPCWCCVHDWNCREVDLAIACWLWFIASLGESQEVSVSWYIAAPSPALLWRSWSLALNPSYTYWVKMIKIVAPWYFSPLVWHALQLSAMSATVPDVRHTMWSTRNTFGFGTLSLSLPKRFISTDVSPFGRYPNSLTRECGTGESSYRVPKHWEEFKMFRCCPMMWKRANKASYTIEKVTCFVYLYQLCIQLPHVMSDDLDIFCLIVTCN